MRIGFLTPEYVTEPSFYGGLSQHLYRLAAALVAEGHAVEIFVNADREERLDHEGVLVHRVPPCPRRWVDAPLGALSRLGILRMPGTRSIMSRARGLDRALRRRAKEVTFDVIEASGYLASGLYAVRRPVAPIIVFAPSFEPLWIEARRRPVNLDTRLWFRFEAESMKRASAVYSHCRFVSDEIARRLGVPAKVVLKPYRWDERAEDPSQLARVADWPSYLFYFGKFVRYKGSGILADAVVPLFNEIGDLRLVMAGAEPSDEDGRKLASLAVTRPDRVRHLGLLKPEQIMPLVARARAVALPSFVENLPNVALEAMAKGAVVIGPNGASFDELIDDGKTGLLFKLGDAGSLREAIARAWQLPDDDRRRIGAAAKARIELMDPKLAVAELMRFYESVIEREKPGGRV